MKRLDSQSDFRITFGEIQRTNNVRLRDFTTWRMQEELRLLFRN